MFLSRKQTAKHTVSIMKFCRVFQLEKEGSELYEYETLKHDHNNLGQGNITIETLSTNKIFLSMVIKSKYFLLVRGPPCLG